MLDAVHRLALRTFRRMPTIVRRWIVRAVAPSYTVGSICVIERPDGAILLVRQAYRSRWGIPGGLLKRGEDPEVAARREVFEEVGIAVELVGEPAMVVDARPQRIDVVYRARPVSHAELERLRPASIEIEEVRWFRPDELPELQFETAGAFAALAAAEASRAGRTPGGPAAESSSVPPRSGVGDEVTPSSDRR